MSVVEVVVVVVVVAAKGQRAEALMQAAHDRGMYVLIADGSVSASILLGGQTWERLGGRRTARERERSSVQDSNEMCVLHLAVLRRLQLDCGHAWARL